MGLTKGNAMRRRVLIANDNAFVRTVLYQLFEREPDFQVCAMAENGREAIEEASRLHPDLVVMNRTMPMMNGIDAARILKDLMPNLVLIIYCATPEESSETAKSLGAYAILSKSDNVSVLIEKSRALVDRRAG
jgi:DNA-binding NarL/FixJ family response regulator